MQENQKEFFLNLGLVFQDFIAVEKQQGVRYIILDMASCTYIDFSGLRIVKQVNMFFNTAFAGFSFQIEPQLHLFIISF